MARRWLLAVSLAPVCTLACAQLLSYDDYAPRPEAPAPRPDVLAEAPEPEVSADSAETGEQPARTPARPTGAASPGGGTTLWIAAKRMYLGSQTSLGVESSQAWRDWGLDLDRVCTSIEDSVANVGTCRRPTDAIQTALQDGDRCRDNNFGQHVIPLIKLAKNDFEFVLNDALLNGESSTWLIAIDDLGDGPDDAYAPGRLYFAAPSETRPAWDGTDVRDVRSDTVADRDLTKPTVVFDRGYVKDNVWVSGVSDLVLPTPLTKQATANLRLKSGSFVVSLGADHKSAGRATVAGAIPLATVEDLVLPVASSGGFCPGSSLYENAKKNVMRMPDVVIGAPNLQDESKTCDGISIGVGVDFAAVKPPTAVVDPPIPKPGPCDG